LTSSAVRPVGVLASWMQPAMNASRSPVAVITSRRVPTSAAPTVIVVIVVVVVVVGLRFTDQRWWLTLLEPLRDHLDQVDRRRGAVLGDAVVVDRAVVATWIGSGNSSPSMKTR
jgi:hypothetical protein